MSLYLVHLAEPFGASARQRARHYLGFTRDRDGWRLRCHANGTGANLLRHVRAAGIGWQLVRVWPDVDRHKERRIKTSGTLAKVCPLCIALAGHRHTLPGGRWLGPAPDRPRRCRCGSPAVLTRSWGRGAAGVCLPCAGRYSARSTGATDAELAAGTYPLPRRTDARRAA